MKDAENTLSELWDAYLCEDPYACPEGPEPTLDEQLSIGENNLNTR
jgi:hypothetical protein